MNGALIKEINIDKNTTIKLYKMPLPRAIFNTIPILMPFESVNAEKNYNLNSILSIKPNNKAIIAGIPSMFLAHILLQDNQFDLFDINVSCLSNSTIIPIDQPSPQRKYNFSMTFRDGPNKLGFFVPLQLISSNFNEQITFSGSISNEGKSRSFTGVFDLNVLPPFSMVTMSEAINDANLLLKVTITNNAEFELRDIYIEISPTSNFIFKESCLKIADVMEPNCINSSVFEIERKGNEILNATEIGNLKVKFMLNGSKFEYNHFTPIVTEAISKRNSPILFKWMNYDDVQSVLHGFIVDLEVTNSCNEERSFVIQIATDTTNLMPNGVSSFNIEKLPSKAKTTLKVNLMALKRGFFVFPRIFVQGLPEGDFTVEIQNGIMVTD